VVSEENVEIVRRHIDAWDRRDLATWLASFHPDAEADWSRAQGPFKGVYRGHRELEAFWNVWLTFEEGHLEAHGFTPAGSAVVVPNTAHFGGRDGIQVVASSAFVFTIEDGQITRLRLFQEETEAREAAGLRD
jgi:ketosteroid isomerase-like protein